MAVHLALANQPCSGSTGGGAVRRKRLERAGSPRQTSAGWILSLTRQSALPTHLDQLLLGVGMESTGFAYAVGSTVQTETLEMC